MIQKKLSRHFSQHRALRIFPSGKMKEWRIRSETRMNYLFQCLKEIERGPKRALTRVCGHGIRERSMREYVQRRTKK